MKILITLLLQIIAYAGGIVSSIWAIIEFIVYLVKDHPFNWWSVWTILICIGVGIVCFFANLIFMTKNKSENRFENRFNNSGTNNRFSQRLEEMRKRNA